MHTCDGKRLNWVKIGSQWAHFTCLCTPNGRESLSEKRVLHPFLTHFWLQNAPFSRSFAIFHAPKRVTTGSKQAKTTCLNIPNGLGSLLEKPLLNQLLIHFWSQNAPFSRSFGIVHAPKHVTMRSKRTENTCLSIPGALRSLLEKRIFNPFFTHFRSQNRPFSRHFRTCHGAKRVPAGSTWVKKTCLSIPSGLASLLEKHFLTLC